MSLADGYHDVPQGKVAAVVTHLEMRAPATERAVPEPAPWSLRRVERPTMEWYRALFRAVGGDWLWFSRLVMPDHAVEAIISDPDVEIWTLSEGGQDAALLELDFREPDACELAYFGLAPALVGRGAGRFLMNAAIRTAWARPIARFHVHTCTLDSPAALPFYVRSGFVPYRQQIEVADDPRLTGLLPRDNGQHVPVFE